MTDSAHPDSTALVVPFKTEEVALLTERAAAHGVPVVELVRFCALTTLTPMERRRPPVESEKATEDGREEEQAVMSSTRRRNRVSL